LLKTQILSLWGEEYRLVLTLTIIFYFFIDYFEALDMTINFVAIAKRDKKGIRIKSCYSEKPEFRDNFERVTIESLLGVTTVGLDCC
jgi:hypothetical protein